MTSSACDVAVLGSGLSGSVLAACLARAGLDVIVIDAGQHPRFAIGESTVPYTSTMLRLISERYEVPEIKYLAAFETVQKHVSKRCGIKRNFGFVYHRPHEHDNHQQTNQFPISKIAHTENHLMRADVDQWMIGVAQRYGAVLRERTTVTDLDFTEDAVTLTTDTGDALTAKFLVDASGARSVLAAKLGLREEPTRLRTHSRSIFTHMTGVRRFEDTVPPGAHQTSSPWSQGTLHHVFPGGWMWVIPFDNHPLSRSDLCSVGISYDPRIHPAAPEGPEAEFRSFLDTYPDVAPQFAGATATRPWISTGRLQYSSTATVGHRWCLTAHSSGFIDALFSRGLQNTMSVVHSLAWRLIDAVRDNDFQVERFRYVERLEQGLLDVNDQLVAGAYTSFRSWDLWDLWFRVWETTQVLSTMQVSRAYAKFVRGDGEPALRELAEVEPYGALPRHAPARGFLRRATDIAEAVQDERLAPAAAATGLEALLRDADFIPPSFHLADRTARYHDVTPLRVAQTLAWARFSAPPEIRELFGEGMGLMLRRRLSPTEYDIAHELRHTGARLVSGLRRRGIQPI